MNINYTIIGAGVVGLAIANTIAESMPPGASLLLVEKESSFGHGVSSRNSEVIHSGIYYPQGSLRHRLCIRGRELIYAYCRAREVPHQKCGKLVVATDEGELDALEELHRQAERNAVENVTMIDGGEARLLEPDVKACKALYSAETGIVDTHALMNSLVSDITDHYGMILYRSKVTSIHPENKGFTIGLENGTRFFTDWLINAAGLGAVQISQLAGVNAESMYPCKGTYFWYSGTHRCRHLIYPLPYKGLAGLGVHATIDMGNRLRFGPDVEYVESDSDYSVNEEKKDAFFSAAGKILDKLDYYKFHADTAGIRPKIRGPHDIEMKDFYIKSEIDNGMPRFINLLGIDSPGLTSSLAIGEHVRMLMDL